MNYFLFTTFLVFLSNEYHSNAHKSFNTNYFEGTITYKGEFIRKTSKFDSTTLAFFAGESSTLYAKEGNFLMKVKRGFTVRFLYRKEENKFYREKFNSDSVYWTRCDQQGQKILKMTRRIKEEKILGIECDELKVYYENKTVSYYYNSDTLKANPAWFKYLTIDNENLVSIRISVGRFILATILAIILFLTVGCERQASKDEVLLNKYKTAYSSLVGNDKIEVNAIYLFIPKSVSKEETLSKFE